MQTLIHFHTMKIKHCETKLLWLVYYWDNNIHTSGKTSGWEAHLYPCTKPLYFEEGNQNNYFITSLMPSNYSILLIFLPSVTWCMARATYSTLPAFNPAKLILPSFVKKMLYFLVNSSHISESIPVNANIPI